MQKGDGLTKGSFEVEKKFRGLENIPNQSLVPRRSQAFEESRTLTKKQPEDPLKQVLIKQTEEEFDTNSYTITLMTDLVVQNIANFCYTEIQNIKHR